MVSKDLLQCYAAQNLECTSTKLTIRRRLLHVAQYVQLVAILHAYRDAEHNIRKNRDNILSNRCKPRHIMALVVSQIYLACAAPADVPWHNTCSLRLCPMGWHQCRMSSLS